MRVPTIHSTNPLERLNAERVLDWLKFQGHRAEFDELGARVAALDEKQFAALRLQIGADSEAVNKLDVVRSHYASAAKKSLLAWDLIRYITLCRWGVLTFDSWEDLQTNYLLGPEFWSLEQTKKTGARFQAAFKNVSDDPASPWNKIPWNSPLDISGPIPAAR